MPTNRWSGTFTTSSGPGWRKARSAPLSLTRCFTTTRSGCTGFSAKRGVGMAPILEGIRVIDLSTGIAGPGSSMYLADQGADVVRIDTVRGSGAAGSADPALENGTGFSV